jgi:hypothetical protein
MIETYIDMLLLAIINSENFYLFEYSGNFGFGGNLTFSD